MSINKFKNLYLILNISFVLIFSNNIYVYANDINQSKIKAANDYVNKVVKQGEEIIRNKNINANEKYIQTEKVISENLDLEWMAKYTLGRYRKTIVEDKIKEFISTYSKYVIKTYSELVKSYNGDGSNILKVEILNEKGLEYIVKTELLKSNDNKQSIKVDYLVRNKDNNSQEFKIFDIVTEGISMINAQRSEFSTLLMNQGIDALISQLKSKL